MDCKCFNSFFAVLILVFSFWQVAFSKWIIVGSAALILIEAIWTLSKEGCCCGSCSIGGHKTGEELFVEKEEKSDLPSKDEIKEVMKVEKPKEKKKVAAK